MPFLHYIIIIFNAIRTNNPIVSGLTESLVFCMQILDLKQMDFSTQSIFSFEYLYCTRKNDSILKNWPFVILLFIFSKIFFYQDDRYILFNNFYNWDNHTNNARIEYVYISIWYNIINNTTISTTWRSISWYYSQINESLSWNRRN